MEAAKLNDFSARKTEGRAYSEGIEPEKVLHGICASPHQEIEVGKKRARKEAFSSEGDEDDFDFDGYFGAVKRLNKKQKLSGKAIDDQWFGETQPTIIPVLIRQSATKMMSVRN
jgi:hypothetical protein